MDALSEVVIKAVSSKNTYCDEIEKPKVHIIIDEMKTCLKLSKFSFKKGSYDSPHRKGLKFSFDA